MKHTRLFTIALAVLVGGACSSALAGPPEVVPGPSDPVSVTEANSNPVPAVPQPPDDRMPYAEIASTTFTPAFVNSFINFPTPPDRRYFIEQASVTCVTPSGGDLFTQALLTVTKYEGMSSTSLGSPVVVLKPRGPAFLGGILWSGSANVKVISDANPNVPDGGGAMFFNIFHTDSAVTATCTATLFGYSVPL